MQAVLSRPPQGGSGGPVILHLSCSTELSCLTTSLPHDSLLRSWHTDFHPQSIAHAGRTQGRAYGAMPWALVIWAVRAGPPVSVTVGSFRLEACRGPACRAGGRRGPRRGGRGFRGEVGGFRRARGDVGGGGDGLGRAGVALLRGGRGGGGAGSSLS